MDFVIARRERRARDSTVVDLDVFLCDDEGINPRFIGITGLFNIDTMNETCSVGILIHPDYFRGGYATQTLYTVLKFAFEDDSKNMHHLRPLTDNPRNNSLHHHLARTQYPSHLPSLS